MNFWYRIMRFMSGRYGFDTLSGGLIVLACALAFLNIFFWWWVLQLAVYLLMLLAAFRVLSRNTESRRRENAFFLNIIDTLKRRNELQKQKKADKFHVYRRCPVCRAILRLPRRIGKHNTVCPKCGKEFKVTVRK